MKLSSLLSGIDSKFKEVDINNISSKSDEIKQGDLFIAIKGYNDDGHNFIKQAIDNGAVAVVCEEYPSQLNCDFIVTENTRKAFSIISANYFNNAHRDLKLIGITGTNGKTTTCYEVYEILKDQGKKCGLIGTNQVIIGSAVSESTRTTPDAYDLHEIFSEMKKAGCEYVIMEVSSHALQLYRVYGLRFTVAAFSNLTAEHLDFHENLEEYFKAKSKLFLQSDKSVINYDDSYGRRIKHKDIIYYSVENSNAHIYASNIKLLDCSINYVAAVIGEITRVKLRIPGMFSVYNSLCALAISHALGISIDKASQSLAKVKGIAGRAEVVYSSDNKMIMIDYAHTKDGIENILKTVRVFTKGKIISLFGCGGNRDKSKRAEMAKTAEKYSDFVVVTSDNVRFEKPMDIINDIIKGFKNNNYTVIEDREKAIIKGIEMLNENDILVLMGKGHETYNEICGIKYHFDERDVVREYFRKNEG